MFFIGPTMLIKQWLKKPQKILCLHNETFTPFDIQNKTNGNTMVKTIFKKKLAHVEKEI